MEEKIVHSDIYKGEDYSDGILHYKYIKKEKINGRWVYYYDIRKLMDKKDIIEKNINTDKYYIDNNIKYKSPYNGKTYGPDHYKKALKYDKLDLAKTNATIQGLKLTADTLNRVSKFIMKTKLKYKNISKNIKDKGSKFVKSIKNTKIVTSPITSNTSVITSSSKNVNVRYTR